MRRGTSVAALIFLGHRFHFKAIKGTTLLPDANFREAWTNFSIEEIFVHRKEGWGVAETYESRGDWRYRGRRTRNRSAFRMRPDLLSMQACGVLEFRRPYSSGVRGELYRRWFGAHRRTVMRIEQALRFRRAAHAAALSSGNFIWRVDLR